jgi:hypothetical protein
LSEARLESLTCECVCRPCACVRACVRVCVCACVRACVCLCLQDCGILTPGGLAIEGPVFRNLTPAQLDELLPRIQVSRALSH